MSNETTEPEAPVDPTTPEESEDLIPYVEPDQEGEVAPVSDDYPEVETDIRSEEETAEAENREPVEPSPGWEPPEDVEEATEEV